jgi:calmodulin
LDSNRDDQISVNEFCLCIEGIQKNLHERLRSFDPDLEKSLKEEISQLFDFFDSNKDGRISVTELHLAIKAQNPHASTAQINQIMKEADKDNNKEVDRGEFTAVMLPQMKLEVINNEKDFDDLRRLFKQFDSDQNNFLGKQEFKEALSHLQINLSEVQLNDLIREIDLDNNGIIDIDEFIAFLSLAEQVKFKNPANKAILVKIRHARKLQPMDFFNCFKNLPQTFQPAMTSEFLERKDKHTLSWGLYPQYDTKTMTYRELGKLEEVQRVPTKTYIAKNPPGLAAEITLEETFQIPIPKKEDFQWDNITNREIRACLIDMRSKEILSNVWNVGVSWR